MESTITRESLRYCLYARKSTDESAERQVMSIDSQIKEMLALAQRENLRVMEVKREAHSAKSAGQRPIFNQMIDGLRIGKFNAILTWAPDRLSRNAGDLGQVVDLFDQKLLEEVRTYSQRFTNNPNEKFMLMIIGAQGKLENDQKGLNVKRGLRAKCELGLWPAPAPTGYLNHPDRNKKCHVVLDPHRAPIIRQMFEKIACEGWSGRKVHKWLREIGFTTVHGKPLWLSNTYKILDNLFYTGEFRYPLPDGPLYKGVHDPIISTELFMEVQKRIKLEQGLKYENKEFAFTKLMRCGRCDSGITAEEKHKKLKDGTTATYIYYGCTRAKDLHCNGGYLREEELVLQLAELIDRVNLDELGVRKRLKEEVERYYKFQNMLGREKDKVQIMDVDMKNYAKYILQEGSIFEKRELLTNLKNRIVLKDKMIMLA